MAREIPGASRAKMIRLVVNADDLGLDSAIDAGIFEAHRDGIVTSASLLVTGRSAETAALRSCEEGLAVGVHLCLCTHLPPAADPREVRWLAPGARLRSNWVELAAAWAARLVPAGEVELELRAQVARAHALGIEPDHLDCHQHLHFLPGLAPIVERIASEEGLPLRWPQERPRLGWLARPTAAAKSALLTGLGLAAAKNGAVRVRGLGIFEAGSLDEVRLLCLLGSLAEGDYELGCHPGRRVGFVPEDPTWRYGWDDERKALCSRAARAEVERRGIRLCTYCELAGKIVSPKG